MGLLEDPILNFKYQSTLDDLDVTANLMGVKIWIKYDNRICSLVFMSKEGA